MDFSQLILEADCPPTVAQTGAAWCESHTRTHVAVNWILFAVSFSCLVEFALPPARSINSSSYDVFCLALILIACLLCISRGLDVARKCQRSLVLSYVYTFTELDCSGLCLLPGVRRINAKALFLQRNIKWM